MKIYRLHRKISENVEDEGNTKGNTKRRKIIADLRSHYCIAKNKVGFPVSFCTIVIEDVL